MVIYHEEPKWIWNSCKTVREQKEALCGQKNKRME